MQGLLLPLLWPLWFDCGEGHCARTGSRCSYRCSWVEMVAEWCTAGGHSGGAIPERIPKSSFTLSYAATTTIAPARLNLRKAIIPSFSLVSCMFWALSSPPSTPTRPPILCLAIFHPLPHPSSPPSLSLLWSPSEIRSLMGINAGRKLREMGRKNLHCTPRISFNSFRLWDRVTVVPPAPSTPESSMTQLHAG